MIKTIPSNVESHVNYVGGKQKLVREMMAELWAIFHPNIAENMEKK